MITAVTTHALALDRGGRRLFESLSFTLNAGEALALTGPNGAGKTSLLRALAGLLRPTEGEVRFAGPLGPLDSPSARAAALHWLGAQDGLKGARTAEAELRFWSEWTRSPDEADSRAAAGGGSWAPHPGGEAYISTKNPLRRSATSRPAARERDADERVARALGALGLLSHASTQIRRLSTGQRRRLALARLLVQSRPLWLLDEPLAPLDAAWRARLGELMREHLDDGGLLIAAVHDPLPIAARELQLEAA